MNEFILPPSIYLSDEAKQKVNGTYEGPPVGEETDILEYRTILDRYYWGPMAKRALEAYSVKTEKTVIAGVKAELVTPADGPSDENSHRILICLHGGGFKSGGGGPGGLAQSVPFAATGRIRVIAVDYRLGPEHKFPSASEDVVAVYRELLKEYQPGNIGIYGISAGAILTGMTIAWLLKEQVPLPGAIGIFGAPAAAIIGGDSRYTNAKFFEGHNLPETPNPPPVPMLMGYLGDIDLRMPLASPIYWPEILAKFPPTLLLTGTRAMEMSAVVFSHTKLVEAGVKAALHLWDGLWHSFHDDVDLPESRQVYNVVTRFFSSQLGRQPTT